MRLLRGLADLLQNKMPRLRDFLGIRGTRVEWTSSELDLLGLPESPGTGQVISQTQLDLFADVALLNLIERRLHLLWDRQRDNFSYPGMAPGFAYSYAQLFRPSVVREYIEQDLARLAGGLLVNPLDRSETARTSLGGAAQARRALLRTQRRLAESIVEQDVRADTEAQRQGKEEEPEEEEEETGLVEQERARQEVADIARELGAASEQAGETMRSYLLSGPGSSSWQFVAANAGLLADAISVAKALYRSDRAVNPLSGTLFRARYLPDQLPSIGAIRLALRFLAADRSGGPSAVDVELPRVIGQRMGRNRALAIGQDRTREAIVATWQRRLLERRMPRLLGVLSRLADALGTGKGQALSESGRRRLAFARLLLARKREGLAGQGTALSLALSHDAWLGPALVSAGAQLSQQPKALELLTEILEQRLLRLLTDKVRTAAIRYESEQLQVRGGVMLRECNVSDSISLLTQEARAVLEPASLRSEADRVTATTRIELLPAKMRGLFEGTRSAQRNTRDISP